MNEIEHFFDVEIEQAQERIENDDIMCFNGVKVGKYIEKELNEKHISFCENAKNALKMAVDDRTCQIAEMKKDILKKESMIEKFTADFQRFDAKIKDLETENERLQNTNDEMQKRIEHLEADKSELRTRCKESATDSFDKHLYSLLNIVGREDLYPKQELPEEPIKVAEMLIDATEKRENCMTGKEYDKPVYEKWQLERIARHLLVHCGKYE